MRFSLPQPHLLPILLQTCLTAAFACLAMTCSQANDGELRTLNTVTHFTPPTSLEAWQPRAEELRLQLRVSLGLYPRPELDPVQPTIYGRLEFGDYTIEKVTFESLPGFYVTGNLYRPVKQSDKPNPGVLCPHGHWTEARFYEASDSDVRKLLATGAERFESAARNHIQARCVQLARMGCVVFHWDMIGYCDSRQISFDRAHRYGVGENLNPAEDEWLLFSSHAESRLQNVLGLQTLAIQRAVDMLLTLPDVDPNRIAITGASGGGTQSFLGAALDERIQVAFPAVMVSTGMQGGCTCENACLLRTGTVNVEMAALAAPRPLGLTAADDWTRTMPEDGFPELQKLYQLFGAKDKVALFPALHFGHNFNHVSRVGMYGWLNKHFQLGQATPVLEREFERATQEQLSVWDDAHPEPPSGLEFERGLLKLWHEISTQQLLGLAQGDAQQRNEAREILRNGWRVCLGLTARDASSFPQVNVSKTDPALWQLGTESLGSWRLATSPASKEANEAASQVPPGDQTTHAYDYQVPAMRAKSDLQILVSNAQGKTTAEYFPLLAGRVVTDKQNAAGEAVLLDVAKQRLVENPRPAAAYTYGYNLPLFAQRAQQLAATILWTRQQHSDSKLHMKAQGPEAAVALAAVFIAQQIAPEANGAIELELDLGAFRFAKIEDIRDPHFLPGSTKYLDIPGLIASLDGPTEVSLVSPEVRNELSSLNRLVRAKIISE